MIREGSGITLGSQLAVMEQARADAEKGLLIKRSMTKDCRLIRRRISIQQLGRLLSVCMTKQSAEKDDCDGQLYQISGLSLVQPQPMKQDELQII